jgi:hypothetical protein
MTLIREFMNKYDSEFYSISRYSVATVVLKKYLVNINLYINKIKAIIAEKIEDTPWRINNFIK